MIEHCTLEDGKVLTSHKNLHFNERSSAKIPSSVLAYLLRERKIDVKPSEPVPTVPQLSKDIIYSVMRRMLITAFGTHATSYSSEDKHTYIATRVGTTKVSPSPIGMPRFTLLGLLKAACVGESWASVFRELLHPSTFEEGDGLIIPCISTRTDSVMLDFHFIDHHTEFHSHSQVFMGTWYYLLWFQGDGIVHTGAHFTRD